MIGYFGVRVQRLVRYLPDDAVIDVTTNLVCSGVIALNVLTTAHLKVLCDWPLVCLTFKTDASKLWFADRRRTGSPRGEDAGDVAEASW